MSLDSRVKTAELYDAREQAYASAMWFGMFDLMDSVGSLEPHKLDAINDLGSHVVRVCVNVAHKPEHLLSNLSKWSSKRPRRTILDEVGMYDTNGQVHPSIESAAQIRQDEEWQTELLKESTFGGLLQVAQEVANYYTPRAISAIEKKNGFNEVFRDIQRDVNFYVGLYDPER